jgi:YVTN family beta-propeller protein
MPSKDHYLHNQEGKLSRKGALFPNGINLQVLNLHKRLFLLITGIAVVVILVAVLSLTHVITVFSGSHYTTFTETGLPAGTNWSVTYDGVVKSSTSTAISFSVPSGSYSYNIPTLSNSSIGCGVEYLPSQSGGTAAAGSTVSVSFGALSTKCRTAFNETGLPAGATWYVTYDGIKNSSDTSSMVISTASGSHSFNVSFFFNSSSKCSVYSPSPNSGTAAAGKTITIRYTNTSICNSTVTMFNETGLPKETNWSVTYGKAFNYSNSSSISFLTKPGAYFYRASSILLPKPACLEYIPSPSNGTVTAGKTVVIKYTNMTACNSTVTMFNETGLPSNMTWSVTYDGVVNRSNTSHINVSTALGNYSFIVSSPSNSSKYCKTVYKPYPDTGTIKAGKSTLVKYNASNYCMITFNETGLPTDTSWAVSYDGLVNSSSLSSIKLLALEGTHSYNIPTVLVSALGCSVTYSASPNSGTAKTNSTVSISFKISSEVCTTDFVESNLPADTNWSVTYNGATKSSVFSAIPFSDLNGTYSYSAKSAVAYTSVCNTTYSASPSSGTARTNSTVSISYSILSRTCITKFTETGLPKGTDWSATYNGKTGSSNSTAISFYDLNGSYSFSVKSVLIKQQYCNTTYSPSPSNGTAITGSSVSILYSSSTTCTHFTTTFNETGLPKGTNWSVTYNGVKNFSTTPYITFSNLIGNYSYNLSSPFSSTPGCTPAVYTPNPKNGSAEAGATVDVKYNSSGVICTTKFTAYDLPAGAFWNVTYNGVTESSTNDTIIFKESSPLIFSYSVPDQLFYKQSNYCGINSYYLVNVSSGKAYGGSNVSVSFTESSGCTLLYVANYESDSVSIINTTENVVVSTIGISSGPFDVAIIPNGKLAYVADEISDNVSVVNTSSDKVILNIKGFHFPRALVITPNGKLAYVGGLGASNIAVINLTSNSIVDIGGVSSTFGMAITPNGKLAYVADEGSNLVSVINVSSNTIIDNISGFSSPYSIAITPNGKLAYVADEGSNSLSIINLSSNSIIKTLSGFGFPYSIAITPNGKLAYVVNYESDSVSVINVSSNSVINKIAVGGEPVSVVFTPNGKLAYVVNYESDSVSVINVSSNSVINSIAVGSEPSGAGISILDSI